METVYSDNKLPHSAASGSLTQPSIFLAGPTPRSQEVKSWRPEAIKILKELGFEGIVLVPETQNGIPQKHYMTQVEWEDEALHACDVIAFWVPRNLTTLPGFTTNVEFGRFIGRKSCVYGRPDSANKIMYLDWYYYKETGKRPLKTLEHTLVAATSLTKKGRALCFDRQSYPETGNG